VTASPPSDPTAPKTGNLGITVGTWLFLLHMRGHAFSDAAITGASTAIEAAAPEEADRAGMALVELVSTALGSDADTAAVTAWLRTLLGGDHVGRFEGEDRAARTRQIRAYQFQSNLPFLTPIIDRFPDGTVGSHWVMVERVTDTVTCMDPYPWDDIDEEYTQPLVEFMVKWELAGCESIVFRA
jgi:hypothetical protein